MTTGFGEDPFSDHAFGLPALSLPPRRLLKRIRARRFDPVAHEFVVDQDGKYEESSAVVQWVGLQMTVALGSIPSDTATGNPALRHKYISSGHAARVKQDIELLLNPRVQSGELIVHAVEVHAEPYGTIMGVEFTDTKTGERVKVDNRPRASRGSTLSLPAESGVVGAPVWDPRSISGCVLWMDAFSEISSLDSLNNPLPANVSLVEVPIVVLDTPVVQNEDTGNGLHYAAVPTYSGWANNEATGAYTLFEYDIEPFGPSRWMWTGNVAAVGTAAATSMWWTPGDLQPGNLRGSAIELAETLRLTDARCRIRVGLRLQPSLGDESAPLIGLGSAEGTYSYQGISGPGYRLYRFHVYQPKVSSASNRATGQLLEQTTLTSRPGYEAPIIRALRGYGNQHLRTIDPVPLAALSGDDPNYTIVLSCKRSGSGTTQALIGARDSSGTALRIGFDTSNRATVVRGAASLTESSADPGTEQVLTLIASGTTYTLRRNGTQIASGVVNAASLTMTALELLANGAGANRANAYLQDAVVYSRALNNNELAYVESELYRRITS